MLNSSNCRLGDVIFTACLDMHAETKAELLALKSEMLALESKTQAETLALKSEMQAELLAMKTEMRQMKHGENKITVCCTKLRFIYIEHHVFPSHFNSSLQIAL